MDLRDASTSKNLQIGEGGISEQMSGEIMSLATFVC